MSLLRRGALAVSLISLFPLAGVVPTSAASPPQAPPVAVGQQQAGLQKASQYHATIRWTSHDIPHVVASNYGSLGFGHGFATAKTNLCNLADTLMAVRGERSRYLGPDKRYNDQVTLNATNLQSDAFFTDLHNRRVVEKLLASKLRGPGSETRAMVRGYVTGINKYVRSVGGADGIKDPACNGAPWIKPVKPIDLWYGIFAANLLASSGVFVPQIVDAAPPTPSATSSTDPSGFAAAPTQPPSVGKLAAALGRDPHSPFGSNATAVGGRHTANHRGMLLGNPHFPWRGRYRFAQAQLTIPGKYDVAGASLVGSPVINIGWNKNVAWSHTVSTAYRFTPYEYRSVPGSPTAYLTTEGPKELERRVVNVKVKRPDGTIGTVTEDMYRTHEGYVIDAPDALMPWTPASFFALRDANAEHLRTLDVFHEMAKARNVRDLIRRQDKAAGMPWVNTTAADRFGDVLYADHSVVPNVPNDMAEQCLTPTGRVLYELVGLPGLDGTRASGDCKWRTDPDSARPGVFGAKSLPMTIRRDWVANANDSYWLPNAKVRLEGFARIIGCERCERTFRTRMVYRYVTDRISGADGMGAKGRFTFQQFRGVEHQNRVFGAELAKRGGDLGTVCQAAGASFACKVLARWNAHSNRSSRGAILFREFWLRLPAQGQWEVPFDANHPLSTPRNLNEKNPQVVQAMTDALAYLKSKGVKVNAPLGSQQVAGDEGAPLVPLGGGVAETGNANVVVSRLPASHQGKLYPVSYGSSHIQAVSFTDSGVRASTILTYGQSSDRTRKSSYDETGLYARQKWVRFRFTPREIKADPNYRVQRISASR